MHRGRRANRDEAARRCTLDPVLPEARKAARRTAFENANAVVRTTQGVALRKQHLTRRSDEDGSSDTAGVREKPADLAHQTNCRCVVRSRGIRAAGPDSGVALRHQLSLLKSPSASKVSVMRPGQPR